MASAWRQQRNDIARVRLERALPAVFPRAVLVHAFGRPFVPALPRRAIESYWRAHPLRADALARALAARSGAPPDWTWRLSVEDGDGRPRSFRTPPAPYREAAHRRGPGQCCVCGQPVFRFGWHKDLWGTGTPNTRAGWHACCVAAWQFWSDPHAQAKLLRRVQRRRCGMTGQRLLRGSDVDHRVPLYAVWRGRTQEPWPALLRFWGRPNLQAVNAAAHRGKSADEASERASTRLRGRAAQPAA